MKHTTLAGVGSLLFALTLIQACSHSESPNSPQASAPSPTSTLCVNASNTPCAATFTDTFTFTPTATTSPTSTLSPTPLSTATFSSTPSNTSTSSPTVIITFTATSSPTPTLSRTPSPTVTSSSTNTLANTATSSPTVTITSTATPTATLTITSTPLSGGISWVGNVQFTNNQGVTSTVVTLYLTVNQLAETTAGITLVTPGGPVPVPYASNVSIGGSYMAYYITAADWSYQPGLSYSLQVSTSIGNSSAGARAPGGGALAVDGSEVTWTHDGTFGSLKVYDSLSNLTFIDTNSGVSPVGIPGTSYPAPGNYTAQLIIGSLVTPTNSAAGSSLTIRESSTFLYYSP